MEEKSHKWVYIVIVVAIVALMVAGVVLYRDEKADQGGARQGEGVRHEAAGRRPAGADRGGRRQALRRRRRPVRRQPGRRPGAGRVRRGGTGRPEPPAARSSWTPTSCRRRGSSSSVYVPDKLAAFDEYVAGLEDRRFAMTTRSSTMTADLKPKIEALMPRLTDELKKLVRLPSVAFFPDYPAAPVEQTGAAVAAAAHGGRPARRAHDGRAGRAAGGVRRAPGPRRRADRAALRALRRPAGRAGGAVAHQAVRAHRA